MISITKPPGGDFNPAATPPAVAEFAAACIAYVDKAVGMQLDFSDETLPVLDHYLRQAGNARAELVRLVAPAVGCYFGEVVRRKFGGHWVVDGDDPAQWRIELAPCFLYLFPVGMAAEALVLGDVAGFDGEFATQDRDTDALSEALDAAAPVDEPTYYSLSGRMEIISYAAEFLIALGIAMGSRPHHYTAADYAPVVNERSQPDSSAN